MPPPLIFLMVIFTLVVISTILMALLKAATWWGERHAMSSAGRYYDDLQSNEIGDNAPATTTPQPATTALQSDATYSKGLLDGQARALAIAVKAGKYGETEGIKAVFGVSPSSTNQRYITARAALKTELEKLNNPYPNMTPEQQRAREALGLGKS